MSVYTIAVTLTSLTLNYYNRQDNSLISSVKGYLNYNLICIY